MILRPSQLSRVVLNKAYSGAVTVLEAKTQRSEPTMQAGAHGQQLDIDTHISAVVLHEGML